MSEILLYNFCLRKVSILLSDGFWKSRKENPFHCLASGVLHDLVNATLLLQKREGFRAVDLELLLTSGRLQEFKIHNKNLNQELGPALKSLSSASQNLEVITLTNLSCFKPDPSEALQELLKNSPNLKHIHSEVEFNLKALRNCKKLRTIKLHFNPKQPWYDFLQDERGCLQPLDSLKLFTICVSSYYELQSVFSDYIVIILRHCPALTSFGLLETSKALAQLHRTGILTHVKLRSCCWGKSKHPDREPEWIRDATIYHPFVEELYITVHCNHTIANLSNLGNLVLLDITIHIKSDITVVFYNVLKDIGLQLKYLSLVVACPIDISMLLQSCPNLEALELRAPKYTKFSQPAVHLPNLKYLTFNDNEYEEQRRVLRLFSYCHSLTELFILGTRASSGLDDDTLNKFLRRNSLSNLKIAYFIRCGLTERGFKKFFLNAPKLEIIEVGGFGNDYDEKHALERKVKNALLETNHKAVFNRGLVNVHGKFFCKKRSCY